MTYFSKTSPFLWVPNSDNVAAAALASEFCGANPFSLCAVNVGTATDAVTPPPSESLTPSVPWLPPLLVRLLPSPRHLPALRFPPCLSNRCPLA